MGKKLTTLAVFIVIIFIAWDVTAYKEPKEEPPPKVTRRAMPKEKPYNFPGDYTETHKKLAGIFGEATSIFTGGNVPVLALPPFAMATGSGSPELLNLLTESAFSYFYNDRKVRVVRRDYNAANRSRIRAKHIVIGRVSTIGNQIRVIVRIQDVNTGEILDAFDDLIDRSQVSKHL